MISPPRKFFISFLSKEKFLKAANPSIIQMCLNFEKLIYAI